MRGFDRLIHRQLLTVALATAVAVLLAAASGLAAAGRVTGANVGVELTVKPLPRAGASVSAIDLQRSLAIMRTRLTRLDAQGSVTRRPGSTEFVVRVSAASAQTARADAATVVEQGAIAFYDLTPSLLPPSIDASQEPVATTNLHALVSHAGARRSNAVVVTCDSRLAIVCPGPSGAIKPVAGRIYYYLFRHDLNGQPPYPAMDNRDLVASATRAATDPVSGLPIVTIGFTRAGDQRFHTITRAEALRGQVTGIPQHFAIVVDNRVISFPFIDYRSLPNGIDPTRTGAEITGFASAGEARNLAALLQTAKLPLAFTTISQRTLR